MDREGRRVTPVGPALGLVAIVVARMASTAPARRRAALLRPRGVAATTAAVPGSRVWARIEGAMARALGDAGVEIEVDDLTRLGASALVATALVAWAAGGVVLAGIAAAALIGTVPAGLAVARSRVERHRRAALRSILEGVALDLRSGGTTATALTRLSDRHGWVGREARDVLARVRLGVGLEAALEAWSSDRRRTLPAIEVDPTAGALVVATAVGGRAADALDGLAEALADRAGAEAEARAQAAQGRLSALVVGALPIASLAFTALFDRGAVGAALAHPLGPPCLVVGVALEIVGLLWMRRIVRIDP